jgi:hypothetical protein
MSDLRSELQDITNQFISSVLSAMRSASLSDLTGEVIQASPGRPARGRRGPRASNGASAAVAAAPAPRPGRPAGGGRRKRATAEEVQKQKDAALIAAKALKSGFSKGDVMKKAGSKVDLGRALALLVAEGKLTKKGDRRMTRYWVR